MAVSKCYIEKVLVVEGLTSAVKGFGQGMVRAGVQVGTFQYLGMLNNQLAISKLRLRSLEKKLKTSKDPIKIKNNIKELKTFIKETEEKIKKARHNLKNKDAMIKKV